MGIWNDIFIDALDLHYQHDRVNYYGPVLFHLFNGIFNRKLPGKVMITKSNPDKWSKFTPMTDRYFQTIEEIEKGYWGNRGHHLIYRHDSGMLDIRGYVKDIVLDNPNKMYMEDDKYPVSFYTVGETSLLHAIRKGSLGIKDNVDRNCPNPKCRCHTDYNLRMYLCYDHFFPIVQTYPKKKTNE